jgi:hypothetical protein
MVRILSHASDADSFVVRVVIILEFHASRSTTPHNPHASNLIHINNVH